MEHGLKITGADLGVVKIAQDKPFWDSVADKVNEILQKKLEAAPTVFGIDDPCRLAGRFGYTLLSGDTHVGKLVCIQEKPK